MTTIDDTGPRTYGGWIRPKTFGITVWRFALGTLGTVLLFGTLLTAFATLLFGSGLITALAIAAVGLGAVALVSVTDATGRTLGQRASARFGHIRGSFTGATLYRSGPLASRIGTFRLPGLAAQTELIDATADGYPFAIVHVPSTRHYTIVLAADPDGASLVDASQVDAWVSHYGQWLAQLAREPQLEAASVTIEAAPDTGSRLRRAVEGRADPDAPAVARAMLAEVVDTYPAGSSSVRAYVALTFTSRVHRRARRTEEVVRDLSTRVSYLAAALQATGAGAVRPLSAAGVCELVRTAYDPAAASTFDEARRTGITLDADWENVGPTAAQTNWADYRHDSGVSTTWEMVGAPRGAVPSSVLDAILRPHPDVDRKRLTLLYEPIAPGKAVTLVERQHDRALSRKRGAQKASARTNAEVDQAERAAAEEAHGAGLVNLGMLVTATVTNPERLELARLAVEQAAPASRLTLRVVHGSQDSAFAAALPLGIVLHRHVKVMASLRGAL